MSELVNSVTCPRPTTQGEDAKYEQGSGPIWLDNLECEVEDANLAACSSSGATHDGTLQVRLALPSCGPF